MVATTHKKSLEAGKTQRRNANRQHRETGTETPALVAGTGRGCAIYRVFLLYTFIEYVTRL